MDKGLKKWWNLFGSIVKFRKPQHTEKHFQAVLNNPDNYVIHLKNYRNVINLVCELKPEEQNWEKTYNLIQDAINNNYQVIFHDFIISWEMINNQLNPKIISKSDQIPTNLLTLDLSQHENDNIKKCFNVLNQIITYQMKEEKLFLLINDQIMIMWQDHNQYGLI